MSHPFAAMLDFRPVLTLTSLSLAFAVAFSAAQSGIAQNNSFQQPNLQLPSQADLSTWQLEKNIQQANQERAMYEQTRQQDLAREKTLSEQIAQLKKVQAASGSPTKATSKDNKLVLLNTLLNQTRQQATAMTTSEENLDKWIKYWQSREQNVQWNAEREQEDALAVSRAQHRAVKYQKLEAQTAAGTDHWKQINYMPPDVGYDGWNSIPINRR